LEIKGATGISVNGGTAAATWRTLSPAGYSVEFEATSASNWQSVSGADNEVLLTRQTAAGDASIEFAFPVGFNSFRLLFSDVDTATDVNDLVLTVSTDGGSTYASSGYTWSGYTSSPVYDVRIGSASAASFRITTLGNQAGEFVSGSMTLLGTEQGLRFSALMHTVAIASDASLYSTTISGNYIGSTNRVTHIKVAVASGTMATGTFSLYGLY
jgi:hypothetical protein